MTDHKEDLTDAEIAEDEALCAAATEGPWAAVGAGVEAGGGMVAICPCTRPSLQAERQSVADAAFIAAARTGWPRARAEIRRLRAELARVRREAEAARKAVEDRADP